MKSLRNEYIELQARAQYRIVTDRLTGGPVTNHVTLQRGSCQLHFCDIGINHSLFGIEDLGDEQGIGILKLCVCAFRTWNKVVKTSAKRNTKYQPYISYTRSGHACNSKIEGDLHLNTRNLGLQKRPSWKADWSLKSCEGFNQCLVLLSMKQDAELLQRRLLCTQMSLRSFSKRSLAWLQWYGCLNLYK
jgi:hypothetical protein